MRERRSLFYVTVVEEVPDGERFDPHPHVETTCERCGAVITAEIDRPLVLIGTREPIDDSALERLRELETSSVRRILLYDLNTMKVDKVDSAMREALVRHAQGCGIASR